MNRKPFIVLGILVVSIGVFIFARGCDKRKDTQTSSTALNSGVVEKIVVNPDNHKLTIVTKNKEQNLFLPDRPSSIEIDKNGNVNVTSKQFGTELKPFFGLQMSDSLRMAVGVDGLYYKKLDLGVGVADRLGRYVPVMFGKVSYSVWSNSQVGLTYDSGNHVGLCITVRL